jgi:hypothetical protein
VVLQSEVLVGELLAVDGLATSALGRLASAPRAVFGSSGDAYVVAGEVTALEHEVGDNAVEAGSLVAESVLASAELPEVAGGLGDNIVEEVEGDAARLLHCRLPKLANGSQQLKG